MTLEIHKYIKRSYFGGRCEIFGNQVKGEILHYFDFAGMYSKCMLQKFPIGKPVFCSKTAIDAPGFYNITYHSDMPIPALPFKERGRLLFPNGRLTGLYWYEEILNFIEYGGRILSINYALVYQKEDFVFKEFVETFEQIKLKGGVYKKLGKLIINSLYGGFGMRDSDTVTFFTFSEDEFNSYLKLLDVKSYTKINNCFMLDIIKNDKLKKAKTREGGSRFEGKQRNVAYSSIISSKARIKLYKAFKEVEQDGGRLIYCDTDSIFATYKKNKLSSACGMEIT